MRNILWHTAAEYWHFFKYWDEQRAPKTPRDKRTALRLKTLALIAEDREHASA